MDKTSSVIVVRFVFEMQRTFQTAYLFIFQYKDDRNLAFLKGRYLWSLCSSVSTNTSQADSIIAGFRNFNTAAMVGQVMILN